MADNPLGRQADYPQTYSPDVLFPVERAVNRRLLGLDDDVLPFEGHDVWHGYELSWLDERGLPQVAVARLVVPCGSPMLIESKSLKLYLNSLNQTAFAGPDGTRQCMARDLGRSAGSAVQVALFGVSDLPASDRTLKGSHSLDTLPVSIDCYQPEPDLLRCDTAQRVEETLHSHLFRSNCPITGQPDWGSVIVRYAGAAIDHEALLRYIVSFRGHQGFHEDCVERMFCDITARCRPDWLVLGIQFLRRGGLDINPWRWTAGLDAGRVPGVEMRLARQ